jgi:cation transport regulator ChaB
MSGDNYNPILEYVLRIIQGWSGDDTAHMPTDFNSQCSAIKRMITCDTSGIINTMLDYAIGSAKKVNYTIETNSENLTKELNNWLLNLNIDFSDKIPTGINEFAKEYFSERWKKSSLIGVRIHWKKSSGLILPDAIYLVDGQSLKITKSNKEVLGGVKYSISDIDLPQKNENFIVRKPFAGWNDEYPTPYLFMRGTYKNFVGIDMLKSKGNDILNKIVPYILLLLKGSDAMVQQGQKVTQEKMDEAQLKIKNWLKDYNTESDNGTPVLGFPHDTKLEHLIPNIKNMVSKELYDQGNAAILSSLGLVEIINIGTTRRETIFNPKPFIAETANGVEDFRKLIEDIVNLIIVQNKDSHRKHFSDNNEIKVTNSNLVLQVESMMEEISKAFPRGAIDYQTYIEAMGLDYDSIKKRKQRDEKEGDKIVFYPLLTQNTEQVEDPNYSNEEKDKFITQATEEILGAPYNKLSDLPDYVQKFSKESQNKWMDIWNSAYKYMLKKTKDTKKAEQYAFRVANSRVKAELEVNPSEELTKQIAALKSDKQKLIDIIETQKEVVDDALKIKKSKILDGQLKLMAKLLKENNSSDKE